MREGGADDCELALLQFGEIVRGETPFNFGIARERASAGARDIGEDAIEMLRDRKMLCVGGHDLDSLRLCWMSVQQLLQQAHAMRMKFDGGDCGVGIAVCDGQRLATGSGAAVEDTRLFARDCASRKIMPDERRDELRGFVLDDDLAGEKCGSLRDVSCFNSASR